VINSTKWKFLKFIGLTDLSIVFFTTQFIGFFVFLFAHDSANFFAIQKILIIASIPLLAFSIYYQKYIEKKWCRICLLICTVVLLEMVYLAIFKKEMAKLNLLSVSIFGFLYFSISVLWFYVKKILTYKNELQEFQIKANRFIRNYDIFKNTLLASKKLNFNENENGYILLGNHDAKIKIIIVTSPFCEYCVQIHILLLKILSKYKDEICCDVRFNLDTNRGDKNSLITYYDLIDTYNKEGQFAFVEKLNNLNTNISKLFIEDEKVSLNKILQEQFNWNQKHNFEFTPTLIIGSYLFPKQYDLKDFIYFFDDLIADENFLTNHSRPSAF
jgi:thiol-disulfide isomerase/thioredoxin